VRFTYTFLLLPSLVDRARVGGDDDDGGQAETTLRPRPWPWRE